MQPTRHRKKDGPCRCGATPRRGEPVTLDGAAVVACVACSLDCLTRHLTARASFEDLLGPVGHGYVPSLYPDSPNAIRLREAYDAAQAQRGDSRRCYPPAKDGPLHASVTGLTTGCGRRVSPTMRTFAGDSATPASYDWSAVTCERCLEPGARQRVERILANDVENWGAESIVTKARGLDALPALLAGARGRDHLEAVRAAKAATDPLCPHCDDDGCRACCSPRPLPEPPPHALDPDVRF